MTTAPTTSATGVMPAQPADATSTATATATTTTTKAAPHLTVQEKLLLSQAVYKLGAASWPGVSKLLLAHPCCSGRPTELFTPEACERDYVELMTSIGINVPAPDGMKPLAKVHLRLAQTFYLARMTELQTQITTYEQRFQMLMKEVHQLKTGELDGEIRAELRGTLARKYGKRLLDTWVPEEGAVSAAIEQGPVKDGEVDEEAEVEPKGVNDIDMDHSEERQGQLEADAEKAEKVEEAEVAAEPKDEEQAAAAAAEVVQTEEEKEEEVKDEGPTRVDAGKEGIGRPSSPKEATPATPSARGISPASELSPAPSDRGTPSPAPEPEEATTRRGNKRRASTQPRGAPASKRSGRRSAAAAEATASPAPPSEAEADGDVEMKGDEEDAEAEAEAEDAEPEAEEEEEETPATATITRGRRAAQRDRESTSRAPPSSKSKRQPQPQYSPAASTRTKDSSPAISRRAPSVSSTTSVSAPAPAPAQAQAPSAEERRSSRRSLKGRGMRDDVVSKSVREQSAALESVKAEDEEEAEDEEKKVTRSSGRRRGTTTQDKEVATPSEKRGTRASHKTVRDDDEGSHAKEGDEGVGEDEVKSERERESRQASTPAHTTRSRRDRDRDGAQQNSKASQKMLLSLLDTISSHRNGNVFQNPVKKSEAADYFEVIKRPMDLKTVRSKIKDGQIGGIEEFERDVLLIFANAMMYNGPKSQVYDMAKEMLKDAEAHIRDFKIMQHHIRD